MSIATKSPLTAGSTKLISLSNVLPWAFAALFLLCLPLIFQASSALTIMNQMAITIVFALSYNMLLGQGGMLSFGHAVYMGLGGFFAMHVMNMVEDGLWLPLPLLPFVGGLFGLVFAFLIGSFSTRRAGTVFAMISLGVGELIAACSVIIVVFFGGEEGISGDRTMGPTVFGYEFFTQQEVYYLTVAWLLFAALLMFLFSRTPIGRIANAVRDNEERAEFLGYSQRNVRWISFCASGFFAGVAGSLFAINFEILTEENLNLATSGSILLITFIGGAGFFVGPIIGAIIFTLLQTVLGLHTELWALYLGILFVGCVMFFPSGFAGLIAMHRRPYALGKLSLLFMPYFKAAIPAITSVLSLAAILEILFHKRHGYGGDHEMVLYGIAFDSSGYQAVGLAGIIAAISLFLLSRLTPEIRAAWDNANHLEGKL